MSTAPDHKTKKVETNSLDRAIPGRLEARLARYALLAGAAIASTKPAGAGVITTVLPSPVDLVASAPYFFDFNGNASPDVVFYTGATVFSTLALRIAGFTGAGEIDYFFVGGHGGSTQVAFDYSLGAVIGNTSSAIPGNAIAHAYGSDPGFITLDDFTSPGIGFVGIDYRNYFYDAANSSYVFSNHYGFAELNGTSLVGWAYESSANTPITVFDLNAPVPEPGSFALLALGVAGLGAVRKLKSQA
jgi:hypothetical protein